MTNYESYITHRFRWHEVIACLFSQKHNYFMLFYLHTNFQLWVNEITQGVSYQGVSYFDFYFYCF